MKLSSLQWKEVELTIEEDFKVNVSSPTVWSPQPVLLYMDKIYSSTLHWCRVWSRVGQPVCCAPCTHVNVEYVMMYIICVFVT